MEINTDKVVRNYISFLNRSLENLGFLENKNEDELFVLALKNDFYQTNWEILVESLICVPGKEFLEVYGDGADCNGASSRVCFPDKLPTHRIKLNPKKTKTIKNRLNNKNINIEEYTFDSFVSYFNNGYKIASPINGVLLEHTKLNKYSVVDINDVIFEKTKI